MNSSSKIQKIFAKGLCYDKLLLIFVIGAVIGTYYEQILNLVKYFIRDDIIFWESRSGVIYGPFNPLYGFALVSITYLFCSEKKKRKPWQTFLLACLLGGAIEYFVCYLQEMILGTVSWNYSKKFLNIHGRTTIPFMLFWGLCAHIYIYKIYPRLSKTIENLPQKLGKILVIFFTIFLSINMLISFAALIRQDLRRQNIKAKTPIGEFLDKTYPDELLERYYPNMVKR